MNQSFVQSDFSGLKASHVDEVIKVRRYLVAAVEGVSQNFFLFVCYGACYAVQCNSNEFSRRGKWCFYLMRYAVIKALDLFVLQLQLFCSLAVVPGCGFRLNL